jgi:aminopeptidase-like protein
MRDEPKPVNIASLRRSFDATRVGQEMHEWMAELYPICRSITGNGVRETLGLIKRQIPLTVHEVATGTQVFDWTVPKEWNIRDAFVKNSQGERVIDFQKSNLHVLNYSVPVQARISLDELKAHLLTLPEHPSWIPYRTSYYEERWGFCLTHEQMLGLRDGNYDVCIDASLEDGHLTYAECYLEGETADEVLMSSHVCHPSLANDNLSGVTLLTFLARHLSEVPRRYSYRFLFIPGTIGSITWLSRNEASVGRVKHGLVVTCVGDSGCFTYKKSRRGNAEIDRAVTHVLQHGDAPCAVVDFSPYGYDERQFCSPGFDLPVGCLMRTPHGRFPEYHSSADDLNFVQAAALGDSLAQVLAVIEVLEGNRTYVNQNPRCEPQLGKRGLYRMVGGFAGPGVEELAMLWMLNLSDGRHTLLDIAERSGQPFSALNAAADALASHGLLIESHIGAVGDPAGTRP